MMLRQYGKLPVNDFTPMNLKKVREAMIAAGWVRTSINKQVRRITRMLRWGVESGLVAPDVHAACKAVPGLRFGRSSATESEKIKPVLMGAIQAVEPFVSRQVWGMTSSIDRTDHPSAVPEGDPLDSYVSCRLVQIDVPLFVQYRRQRCREHLRHGCDMILCLRRRWLTRLDVFKSESTLIDNLAITDEDGA